MLAQCEKAIIESQQVQTLKGYQDFFRKDISEIQTTRGKTAYAVESDSPEMNKVEKIYRCRDEKIEKGEIHMILPEEEHKRHQKEGTFALAAFSLDNVDSL